MCHHNSNLVEGPTSLKDIVDFTTNETDGCEQLVDRYSRRIEECDSHLGAFRYHDFEVSRSFARGLDCEKDKGRRPLLGVPIAVKEIISVSGMPTRASNHIQVGGEWNQQGPLVNELINLGCVPIGLTCSTEFAFTAINLDEPQPKNPAFSGAHFVTGGSSQGSAVATAANMCGFALGTDTGGSVRLPAALCGVVGYLPTHGLFSNDGVFPLLPIADSIGLFTRNAEDLKFVWDKIIPNDETENRDAIRLAILESKEDFEIDGGIWSAFQFFKAELIARKFDCVSFDAFWKNQLPCDYSSLFPITLEAALGRKLTDVSHLMDRNTACQLGSIDRVSEKRAEEICQEINTLRNLIDEIFPTNCDFFLCPTTPMFAIEQAKVSSPSDAMKFQTRVGCLASFVNKLGLCAISLPINTNEGPMGIQIVGRPGQDRRLIDVAIQLQNVAETVSEELLSIGGPSQ